MLYVRLFAWRNVKHNEVQVRPPFPLPLRYLNTLRQQKAWQQQQQPHALTKDLPVIWFCD